MVRHELTPRRRAHRKARCHPTRSVYITGQHSGCNQFHLCLYLVVLLIEATLIEESEDKPQ